MSQIANKKQAALFATAFWLTYTIARFLSGFIDTKESIKLQRHVIFGVLSAAFSGFLAFFISKLGATSLCAVTQGIGISGIYPLSLALPYEFGLQLK